MNSLIVWFARNRVAANLLMGVIVLSGLLVMLTMVPVESSPQYERSRLFVKFNYPGGTRVSLTVVRVQNSAMSFGKSKSFKLPGL